MKTYRIKYRDRAFTVKAKDEVGAVKAVSTYVNANKDAGVISGLMEKAQKLASSGKEIITKGSLNTQILKTLGIIGLDMYLVGKELTDLVKKYSNIK